MVTHIEFNIVQIEIYGIKYKFLIKSYNTDDMLNQIRKYIIQHLPINGNFKINTISTIEVPIDGKLIVKL